jgi:hypothetical protein
MTDYERGYLQGKADALATQTTASCINRSDVIGMAREAGLWQSWLERLEESTKTIASLEKFAALVAAHEREQCAKICDALAVDPEYASQTSKLAAMAIRDRG